MSALTMDKLVALCKGRGFIYPGSEIYGGLANSWDYGPLGVELKNNVKRAWWQKFVQENKYNVGLDAAILMNREVWVASGHVGGFNDPLMDCRACKARFRADKLIEDFTQGAETGDGWTNAELKAYIGSHLANVQKVELLPYHLLGVAKYQRMGLPDPLPGVPAMDKARCAELQQTFFPENG